MPPTLRPTALALALLLLLAACRGSAADAPAPTPAEPAPTETVGRSYAGSDPAPAPTPADPVPTEGPSSAGSEPAPAPIPTDPVPTEGPSYAGSDPAPAPTPTDPVPTEGPSYAGSDPAPEFYSGLTWLNTERPLTLEDLRGKVVLLDFWTYGCINCMHIIPDLKRLEAEYAEELVVIGVHSAKFANERVTDNIRQVILRYGIEHPVLNDDAFLMWERYGAEVWPTLVLIDPAGNLVGKHAGEGVYELLEPIIASLVAEFDARGEIDRAALALRLEREGLPQTVLSFPGKVTADPTTGRLFISDTNHHRIVVADAASGEVLAVIGGLEPGFADGEATAARFRQPQGLAYDGANDRLYVADTGNHAIRQIELASGAVTTLAGTGRQPERYPGDAGVGVETALNSPWDLLKVGESLYIAMAGSHQLWRLDLDSGAVGSFAGDGREALTDGPLGVASFNQPSGLATDGERLFVADAEASALRVVGLEPGGQVETIVGTGLFDFGDTDGTGEAVRLQHPLGVAVLDGRLYLADTYNSKLKVLDPATRTVTTLAGERRGWRDGTAPRFYEPGGLVAADGLLYVADTNNHAIRVVEPATGATRTLVLTGMERFLPDAASSDYRGTVVTLEPQPLAPGRATVEIALRLPEGYKLNEQAPLVMVWGGEGAARPDSAAPSEAIAPGLPLRVPVEIGEGMGRLTGELTIYYCEVVAQSLCLIEQLRLELPVRGEAGAGSTIIVEHALPVPRLDGADLGR